MAPIVSTPENPPPATATVSMRAGAPDLLRSQRARGCRSASSAAPARHGWSSCHGRAGTGSAGTAFVHRLRSTADRSNRVRAAIEAIGHGHRAVREVHCRGLRAQELHPAQGLADRHHDRARVEAPDATSCSIGVKRRKFCGAISNTSTPGSRATVRSSSSAAEKPANPAPRMTIRLGSPKCAAFMSRFLCAVHDDFHGPECIARLANCSFDLALVRNVP